MPKICFVIMPYGGDDAARKKRFDGVYQAILAPAARVAGYEPKRSDIAGAPGNITHDIIRDLADADVVIADLTDANANVFFELGIRHAFRKSGTVHVVDGAHSLPFDVRQYRAIEYSTELAAVPEVVEQIAQAIRRREGEPARADNPVHDALPQLPLDILATSANAMQKQVATLQAALTDAQTRNDTLTARLTAIDPAGSAPGGSAGADVDVDSLLDVADDIRSSTGPHALLRLSQALKEGGADSFVKALRQVLKSRFLDQNDFAEIVVLCKREGLNEHRRATLEVARVRYPHSDEVFRMFVDALDDSPNQDDQTRGRVLLEQRLGIQHEDGVPRLSSPPGPLSNLVPMLGLLFNFYARQGRYDAVLSVYDTVPAAIREDPMLLRNRAKALAQRGNLEHAQRVFDHAMDVDPTDDQTFLWYSAFLDEQGKYAEAYELSEKAIQADPEYPQLYFHMAILIFNRGFYRDSTGMIVGPVPRGSARVRVAVPFVLGAAANRSASVVDEAVRILVRGGAIAEAQALAAGVIPEGRYDTCYDALMARLNPSAGGAEARPSA